MIRGISLILLSFLFLSLFSVNPIQAPCPTSSYFYIYVDGYNEEIIDACWVKGGVTPYINGSDYPVGYLNVSETYGDITDDYEKWIGNFTFEDTPSTTGWTISFVQIDFYVRSTGTYSPWVGCQLWNEHLGVWYPVGDEISAIAHFYYEAEFGWDFLCCPTGGCASPTACEMTWDDVNNTEIRLCARDGFATHDADDILIIDTVRLKVWYTYEIPCWEDVCTWYGTFYGESWFNVCTWYGTFGDLSWKDVCIWYGEFVIGIGFFFDMCYYSLLGFLGSWIMCIFTTAYSVKNKKYGGFVMAIVFFGIGLALMMFIGGVC